MNHLQPTFVDDQDEFATTIMDLGFDSHAISPRDRRASSIRSISPSNSVEAFADPRRRERSNTANSMAISDLESLRRHRTLSRSSHCARPTFSSGTGIIRDDLDDADSRHSVAIEHEVCLAEENNRIKESSIDFDILEEFIAQSRALTKGHAREKTNIRIFNDLRGNNDVRLPIIVTNEGSFCEAPNSDSTCHVDHEKVGSSLDVHLMPNRTGPNRYSFFSSEWNSTLHAAELGDLVLPGEKIQNLFKLDP